MGGIIFPPGAITPALRVGGRDGFYIKYSSTTAVAILSGAIEANGKKYTLAADTTHTMTSLAAGFDIHYIYIDDDASTAPTAVIIDSITEPAYSVTKRGWYNGDDRCIGIVRSPAASATLEYFQALDKGTHIENTIGRKDLMAAGQNPISAWQDPNLLTGSTIVPVNAISINVEVTNSHFDDVVAIGVSNPSMIAVNVNLTDGLYFLSQTGRASGMSGFVPLDASRNIKIGGEDNDDNGLACWIHGYGYEV